MISKKPLCYQILKKAQSAIEARVVDAYDWLDDGLALRGGVGEKSLYQIIQQASRIADCLPPAQADAMHKQINQLRSLIDSLCELRQRGQGYLSIIILI